MDMKHLKLKAGGFCLLACLLSCIALCHPGIVGCSSLSKIYVLNEFYVTVEYQRKMFYFAYCFGAAKTLVDVLIKIVHSSGLTRRVISMCTAPSAGIM